MSNDIRWIQRFNNYKKALNRLAEAVLLSENKQLSDLERQGVIQAFEFTHELAWNVIKDYLEHQGDSSIKGSRDTTREAFNLNIIGDGDVWMDMIKSRNKTSHTYNEEITEEIYQAIIFEYYHAFKKLRDTMENLKDKEENQEL